MVGAMIDIPVNELIQRETVDSRRHSTGKIGFHNGETIPSRYLKDPIGSCHNICKYGTRFVVEETSPCSPLSKKGRPPLPQGQKSRSTKNKHFPDTETSNTGDSAVKLTSLRHGENTSVKRKKKQKSSLKPSDLDEGQTLERNEINPGDKEKKLSPDLSPRGQNDPVIRIAPVSDEGQNLEVAKYDSKERHETSEISTKPFHDANDHDLVEIPPSQNPGGRVVTDTASEQVIDQFLKKGGVGLAERNKIPEISLRPADSKVEELDGPLNSKLTPTKGEDQQLEKTKTLIEKGNKKVEYRVKSSPRAKNYKSAGFGAVERTAASEVKLQWRPSYHPERIHSKEVGALSRNSPRLSSYRSKGEAIVRNDKKSSRAVKKKNAALSSSSLSPRESHKDRETVLKSECGAEDAKSLKKVRGVSHLKNHQDVRKNGSEQVRREGPVPSSIHVKKYSSSPSSCPGAKSMKYTASNRFSLTDRLPASYRIKYSSRRQRRIQSSEFPSLLSLSAIRKGLRHTQSIGDKIEPSPLLSHLPSESGSPKSVHSGVFSEHDEPDNEKKNGSSAMVYVKKPARDGINTLKDKQLVAKRLNFRKGRVFELEAQDLTPKRLTFRRRMPIGSRRNGNNENFNGGETNINWMDFTAKRLKFKQRMHFVDDKNDYSKNVIGDDAANMHFVGKEMKGKVDEKKDLRSLFNNVIEETASKLVETRRSKVKALVGAFETVISLQDTNTP